MIIVKTMGGLGNQLFQYACGRALALRRGTDLRIWRAPESPENHADQPPRPYRLFDFAVQAQVASDHDLAAVRFTVYENPFTFLPAVLDAPDGIALEGFWQSEKYFADATRRIRDELEFADKQRMLQARATVQSMRQTLQAPVVAVHVRRGDYVLERTRGVFHNLSLDWYRLAMSRLPANVVFLVFSDDIAWCQDNLRNPRVHFASPGNGDLDDLALMRACDGYILANSSFSWWGAWLSDNPQAPVIAPSPDCWFGEVLMRRGLHDASHIIPGRWIQQPDPAPTPAATPVTTG